MRKPQRTFVVEVKQSRRRLSSKSNSIWGDTDLKALANQVESDAMHFFVAPPVVRTTSVLAHGNAEEPVTLIPERLAASPSSKSASETISTAAAADISIQTQCDPSEPMRKGSPKGIVSHVRKSIRRAAPGNATRQVWAAQSSTVAVEELVELENENRRLRKLWHDQLLQQNSDLKMRLLRFSADRPGNA